MKLDHIMYAASDLTEGITEVELLTGVKAEFGGAHPGAGTRNALLSFDNQQYLEIIAPDPDQDLSNGRGLGVELEAYRHPRIRTWAAAVDGFDAMQEVLTAKGYGYNVIDMTRTRPDGIDLAWQILFVENHSFGLALPFFIDWLDSPHPADSSPKGCQLFELMIHRHDDAEALGELIDALGFEGVHVEEGPDSIQALLNSPNGRVVLH